jgi:hypothetical protein
MAPASSAYVTQRRVPLRWTVGSWSKGPSMSAAPSSKRPRSHEPSNSRRELRTAQPRWLLTWSSDEEFLVAGTALSCRGGRAGLEILPEEVVEELDYRRRRIKRHPWILQGVTGCVGDSHAGEGGPLETRILWADDEVAPEREIGPVVHAWSDIRPPRRLPVRCGTQLRATAGEANGSQAASRTA